MVPKVAGKGTSFKGAGLYYLHDKGALTNERVAFTCTENLPTDDPDRALRYMAYTAMRQDELKAASGQARTGRKLAYTVYTYSIAWAPDEAPTQEEMLEAGRETLKVLGIDAHETLMVAHRDEPHPHLHLIVNRVHPETGLAAKLSKDHLELSKWAEAYERRQGQIRCDQRVINNAARRRGQFVKDRRSVDPAAFRLWRKERLKAAHLARQAEEKNLSAFHKGQRQAIFDEKERRIEKRRLEIRGAARPQWAFLFRQQEREAGELHEAQKGAFSRVLYWVQHRKEMPTKGLLRGALEAVLGRHDFAASMHARHAADRKAFARRIAEQSRQAIEQENEAYRTELDRLRHEQAQEKYTLRETHAQASKDLAREIKEGGDRDRFANITSEKERAEERAKPMREQFRNRVRKRIRKARKRDERGKGNERERE
jgi:hypothetical protein